MSTGKTLRRSTKFINTVKERGKPVSSVGMKICFMDAVFNCR
jgi:hypothetical protein